MQESGRINGLDYGRALFSLFVVLWHTHAPGSPDVWKSATVHYRPSGLDLLNFSVLLVAVPFFVLTSCYLYALKGGGSGTLTKRLRRLAVLGLFWPVAYIIFASGYGGIDTIWEALSKTPFKSVIYAFGTVFYFFFALGAALVLTALLLRTRGVVTWIVFLLLCAGIPVMQWLTAEHAVEWATAYWNPVNFFPYAGAAILLVRHRPERSSQSLACATALLLLSVACICLEWWTQPIPNPVPGESLIVPPYTRLSLVGTSAAALILLLCLKRPAGPVVRFMARNSLALYCVHPFLVLWLLPKIGSPALLGIATILGSYAAIALVARPTLNRALLG
ncbi:acyltransferase [Cupriavidus sp. AU9028]|uniref:acyltransferase family protein n=1 Tax=Cupriavidus sp. AU9028 TaxID=2871157 RepID=UPI001C941413|nr:acyltransferase [Cupriavidus sp. AU9028]MBY4898849.1 acyltransferase [Cupriavidus sp. AU9028]